MKKNKDSNIEKEYYEEMIFKDPKTGKKVVKKVKIIKLKTVNTLNDKSVLDDEIKDAPEFWRSEEDQ